jgi:predicted transcriptional regulator
MPYWPCMSEIMTIRIEIGLRYHAILRALNIPSVEWDAGMYLYLSDRPISENSLAEIMNLPRTTIRKHIQDNIRMGFILRSDMGLELSQVGRDLTKEILDEMWRIIQGDQRGFSQKIVEAVAIGQAASTNKKKRTTDLERLLIIGFRPKLRPLSEPDTLPLLYLIC